MEGERTVSNTNTTAILYCTTRFAPLRHRSYNNLALLFFVFFEFVPIVDPFAVKINICFSDPGAAETTDGVGHDDDGGQ